MGTYLTKVQTSDELLPIVASEFFEIENYESNMIINVCRKIRLLEDLNKYYADAEDDSIYHKHMLGTRETIIIDNKIYTIQLYTNKLLFLYPWPIKVHEGDEISFSKLLNFYDEEPITFNTLFNF